jgi:hypothetical protein
MALTALQVEQAGSGKPTALGPGKHPDEHGLYLEVRSATSKSWTGRYMNRRQGAVDWRGLGHGYLAQARPASCTGVPTYAGPSSAV